MQKVTVLKYWSIYYTSSLQLTCKSMKSLMHGDKAYRVHKHRAVSRFVSIQWETALLCNDVSHWLGASPESALQAHGNQGQRMKLLTIGWNIDGLVQDCSNSNALAMKLLQSCTKPSIYNIAKGYMFDGSVTFKIELNWYWLQWLHNEIYRTTAFFFT